MDDILTNIANQAGTIVPILYGLIIAALVDTATGVWAAWNSKTLSWTYLAEFIRSHIAQKVIPILIALLTGIGIGGTDTAAGTALIATAGLTGAAYLASVVASVGVNVQEGRAKDKGLPRK